MSPIEAALDPALVVVIVTIAVIVASGLVFVGVSGALRGWRDHLAGLDDMDSERSGASATEEPGLREEVRQHVVAANRRRLRRGEPPLDVEQEVERRLRELDSLGE
ncbi:MAG: hypothetical protein ACRDK9_05340 [Solirubrobacterales bacterium]